MKIYTVLIENRDSIYGTPIVGQYTKMNDAIMKFNDIVAFYYPDMTLQEVGSYFNQIENGETFMIELPLQRKLWFASEDI